MKLLFIVGSVQVLVSSVSAFYGCEWWGTAPSCGTSSSSIGDMDSEGRKFVASTKCQSAREVCWKMSHGGSEYGPCMEDYGRGCWSGYKRLWCKCYNKSCNHVPQGGDGCFALQENSAFQFFNQFSERNNQNVDEIH
ncbi:hypothetical protein BJ944DRAFT_253035 [Cunninghamella echinulata]|nr:hypothetical protein BJ944DRAFT_253035 [Cunninghamella echinulata]